MSTEVVLSVNSERAASLALVAHHFVSQFEGEQGRQCQAALSKIFQNNPGRIGGELSFGLRGLIQKALQAAYQQGYIECNQSTAGEFNLDIDVPMPSITFAVKVSSALKFAIQTAYTLGRKHGKADQQGAIAHSKEVLSHGQWLWGELLKRGYYSSLVKKEERGTEEARMTSLDHSIHSFDATLIIYCKYRFGTESMDTAYEVALQVDKIVKTWKPGHPLPPEPAAEVSR